MPSNVAAPSQTLVNRLAVFAYLETAEGASTPYDVAGRLVEAHWPQYGVEGTPTPRIIHQTRIGLQALQVDLAAPEASDPGLRDAPLRALTPGQMSPPVRPAYAPVLRLALYRKG